MGGLFLGGGYTVNIFLYILIISAAGDVDIVLHE